MRGGYYHTGDVAIARRGRLHHLRRAHRRRVQGVRLPHLAVRAGERADRARGGRRGRRRAGARPAAARRAEGVRRARPRASNPTAETALAILRYAREHLAPYKRVRRLEFAELPKTICGKIRRVELRTQRGAGPIRRVLRGGLSGAALLGLFVAAPAWADALLYRCGPDVCRAAPDGTGRKALDPQRGLAVGVQRRDAPGGRA